MFIEKYESYFHLSIIRIIDINKSFLQTYLLSSKIILKCFFPFRINELSPSIALILFFFFFFCQARIESIVATGPHEGKNGTKTTLASKESTTRIIQHRQPRTRLARKDRSVGGRGAGRKPRGEGQEANRPPLHHP